MTRPLLSIAAGRRPELRRAARVSAALTLAGLLLSTMTPATLAASTPKAPSNVTVTATSATAVVIKWKDNSTDEDGFQVTNGVTNKHVAANTTSVTWTGLKAGGWTCFEVASHNSGGYSAWSNMPCLYMPTIPKAPTGVTVTATGLTSVRMTWKDNSSNETAFYIFDNATTKAVAAGVTYYDWTGYAAGSNHCFSVRAHNVAGYSTWAAQACLTLPAAPTAPSNLKATATSSSTVHLTWKDNSNNETGFTLWDGVLNKALPAGTTSYDWTGYAPSTYKCFYVIANGRYASSPWSTQSCTYTLAAPQPTATPTAKPTASPTSKPSKRPTSKPSTAPTTHPSTAPTIAPSVDPSSSASVSPSEEPTAVASASDSMDPWASASVAASTTPVGSAASSTAAGGGGSTSPLLLIIPGGLIALALVGLAFLLLRRKRGAAAVDAATPPTAG